MRTLARESAFAILAWAVPFAMSVCIFPLRQWHRPFFESLMGLTLTTNTVILGLLYLRRVGENMVTRAVRIGMIWMVANWALDLAMFSSGPMKMTVNQYLLDIATAYFVIPVITIGLGVGSTVNSPGESSDGSGIAKQ